MVNVALVGMRGRDHGGTEILDDPFHRVNDGVARVRQVGLENIFVGGMVGGKIDR